MESKKSNRRKAIDCQLIEESSTNSGYFKYMITVEEIDGTINKHPAYGVDMQDAIRRLVRTENADKVVRIVEKKQHFFFNGIICFLYYYPFSWSI